MLKWVAAVVGSSLAVAHVSAPPPANLTRGCVERFDPAVDYFPDKVTVDDAVNFSVEYRRSYKVVTVKDAVAGGAVERYVLVQCGVPAPPLTGDLDGAQIVNVPVSSLFAESNTFLPALVDLGRLQVLTGVAAFRYLAGDEILARVKQGGVRQFAAGSEIDAELVVSARPALLMAGGGSKAAVAQIRQAGIPVVANTEWLEPTALARAEWVKYVALFINEEQAAQERFGAMKGRYRALSARATAQPVKPLVMTGRSTQGTFVIAGGRSYVAALIADAGGRYVWADNTAVGAPSIDLEAQIQRASNADVWINGGGWADRAAMLRDEPRYAAFKAYREGQVWVYERRMARSGANDYWSRSVAQPDLVLADLVKIFHPLLMTDRPFEWYMQVPAR